MKRLSVPIRAIIIVIILLSAVTAVDIKSQSDNIKINNTMTVAAPANKDLTFSVLGDVHENVRKLNEIIVDLHKIDPSEDAMILNGDVVDQGLQAQYDSINQVLRENEAILPKKIIKNIGNHEFYNYKVKYNTREDVESFKNRYLRFAGEKEVYHDTWIKGYHFISLGSENGNTKELGTVKAYISEEQIKWFEEKLAEKNERNKPVFVFLHQHLVGSLKSWIGVEQRDEIINILSKYPNVILFTSHTHSPFEDENVTLNQPFTAVHTGAVHYLMKANGKGGRTRIDGSQGIHVRVHGNNIIIEGIDFKNKSWIFSINVDEAGNI